MTAIGDKLLQAGFNRAAFEIKAIAKNWLQNGGSRHAWIQAIDDAADEMRDTGQSILVGNDHALCAGVPHPMPGEGQECHAGNGHLKIADARQPIASEADHSKGVQSDPACSVPSAGEPIPPAGQQWRVRQDRCLGASTGNPITGGKANGLVPVRANRALPPTREPSRAYLDAAAASAKATAKLQLELRQTSTGKVWGAVRPREFVGMVRDGEIAWAIKEAFGPFSSKQENMELREFLPDAVFKKALVLAEQSHVR